MKKKVELVVWKEFFILDIDIEYLIKEMTHKYVENHIEACMEVFDELKEEWLPYNPQFKDLTINTLAKNSELQLIHINNRNVSFSYKLNFYLSYRIEIDLNGNYILSQVHYD